MSGKAQMVRRYYDLGIWDKSRVIDAVRKGWITEGEYAEIVGEVYEG